MAIMNNLIEIELKLKRYRIQFIILFLVWLMGFIFFFTTEPNQSLWDLIMVSLTIRTPQVAGDFSNFYVLVLPILLEVIVFGFITGELLEKFNPVVTSRIIAGHKRNHTIIIGYGHLADRIVEYCIENKKNFSVIEDDNEAVEDLINNGYPVIVGDATETLNLEYAKVNRAKEIFLCINNVRVALICTEKIRALNPECPIYVRVFENHVREYLKQPPLNAFTFSTSKWAMDEIHEWIKDRTGKAIVIGRDNLTHRIAHSISIQPGRATYLFDDEHDGFAFEETPQIHFIQEFACYLSDLRDHVNLNEITQVFICWKKDSEFDESLYLASKLNLLYPDIEVFVRIFDEELTDIVRRYNAKTFSSSSTAFELLQKVVLHDSAIAPER